VLYAVLGGFRTNAQLAESPAALPDPWVLENYQRVLTSSAFWRYALNSTVIAVVTTVVAVVFGLMAAYPLARYRFRWREPIYLVFVLGLLFPATVAIIPLFIIITRQLHLGNTWWGVALPQAAFALPVTIIILRPFLMAIPNELEEAAVIDGASRIQVFWRIIVPLSGPGVVTVGVLAFVASWNAYLLPLLLLQGDMKTLPLGVADFSSQYSSDTAGVFAFTTLAMIPALIFFLALQGRIVNGLQGAVKG
jgi:raffinose/stachyose/melibiose transport system permease protein